MNIIELKNRLEEILIDRINRENNVIAFINIISESEALEFIDADSDWYDLFVNLSTSLDYYEFDETIRSQDSVQLFGDEKLEILIKDALEKIDKIMKEKDKIK